MRVLSALSLLCMSVLGVSSQTAFVMDGSSSFQEWHITGMTNGANFLPNPRLTLTAGSTYTFNVGATTGHPFAFSATDGAGGATTTPIGTTFYNVTQNGCGGDGTSGNGFTGNACVVSLAIAANAPNATIYYKCTIHALMTGPVSVVAAAATTAPTTAAPTTATPTTSAPTGNGTTATPTTAAPTTGGATTATPTTPAPTTGGTITGNSFRITATQGIQAWIFTDKGVQYVNPTLTVTAGKDVTFSIETNTRGSPPHPFGFSNISSNTAVSATQAYFPDVYNTWTVNNGMYCDQTLTAAAHTVTANATNPATNPCVITVKAADVQVSTIYYRCGFHSNMIGTINVVAGGSSSSSTGSGSGSSGSGSGSSSGKNSASTVAGAGMALMVAFIATLFA